MASFMSNFHMPMVLRAFMLSTLLFSLSSLANSGAAPILSATPKITITPTSPFPFQELSPDIAPLLPSPGGVLPTPTGSDIPTIPSNPSPPNPDDFVAPGPAFAPFQISSIAAPRRLDPSLRLVSFTVLAGYLSLPSLMWS